MLEPFKARSEMALATQRERGFLMLGNSTMANMLDLFKARSEMTFAGSPAKARFFDARNFESDEYASAVQGVIMPKKKMPLSGR